MCTRTQALEILQKAYFMCNKVLGNRVHDAYLYGSYARGDYHDESDIDILLTAKMTPQELSTFQYRTLIAQVCSELSFEYDITVSITVKPLEQFRQFQEALPYYRNVINEGIRYAG